jgi:hypothetical protein
MNIAWGLKARFSPRAERAWFAAGLTIIVCAAALAMVRPLLLLFRLVPRNYNEGWNAFWAEAASRGDSLYVSVDSSITNNYPPVSFHLVGRIGELLGDHIIAGRLVALVSLGIVVLAAYLWLRAAGSTRHIALAGAVLLLATFAYYADEYVAVNDPQLLGHAFMLSAIVLLWRLEFSRLAVIGAALLMLAGGFTKHLLIPLPVAVTVWMAMYRRERLGLWLACLAAGVPLGFWLTASRYPSFISELLSSRMYVLHQAMSATRHAVLRFLPLLILGAIPVVKQLRAPARDRLAPRVVFVLLYLVLSLITGAIAGGGEGVTRNAFFDLLIASSLFAALGLEWLWEHSREPRFLRLPSAPAAVVLLAAGISVYALVSLPKTLRAMQEIDALEQDTRTTVAMLEQLGNGRAACETLALCYWARGQFTLDFFNYGQKLRTGALPVEPCKAALQRGDFPILQLEPGLSPQGGRLWPCSPAIHQYYTEVFRSRVGTLLVPKHSVTRRL